jgi:hypothetical protein
MSRKNRAFALAVATAALVGVSAPVASAATFAGPTGFNNDSVLNISGNQLPTQLCNNDIPINAAGVQVPLTAIPIALGLLNTGAITSSATRACTQNPSETNTTTANTGTTVTSTNGTMAPVVHSHHHSTSGFNNDSVINLSGNQVPVQACNNNIPINGAGVQVPVDGLAPVLGLLNTGPLTANADRTCTQNPTESNTTTANTGTTVSSS